ncbi:WD40 repeat domain-containing protein [Streptomyces peucetius]|uniref:WD40 repeat domain-containing protein n=1 Tax=Streptomyces peucetius TaxID=1950 RepID=A0ABY6I7J9_STRPE|nr:WD40 repeat domain-containing protein [Streptomyces peucetius]UYQ62826.1 WD40 repeat domain-containing protein [Streptomyces peucetius]
MRSLPYVTGLAAALVLAAAVPAAADEHSGFTIKDPRITESSGLAASRAHPGIYWTHNDQDKPRVFAVDGRTGETVATITMRGVGEPRDMEAISVGPDGAVYVGDIGDNLDGSWDHVWIYRFPEPERLRDQTVDATQFDVKYADGARNAEALMVHPKTGRVYIASKNEDGGGLYEGPVTLRTGQVNVFRRIGEVPWVTDGAFSPDGKELVLRSYFSARGYAWQDGRPGADHRVRGPIQAQSESVTYTLDGTTLLFGTEGEASPVEPVAVEGGGGNGSGGAKEDGAREDGAKSGGPGDGTAAGGDGEGGATTYGLLVLGGAGVLVLALRRRRD